MNSANRVTIFYFLFLLLALNIGADSPMCTMLLKSPHFEVKRVVNVNWRVRYLWGMNQASDTDNCFAMILRKATPRIIDKIAYNMRNYTKGEIVWRKATLVMDIAKYEEDNLMPDMLLFPEKRHPGSFKAVPNMMYAGILQNFSVTPIQFVFKLILRKFLVIANCDQGFGFLMVKANHTIPNKEILTMAKKVWSEQGLLAGEICENS